MQYTQNILFQPLSAPLIHYMLTIIVIICPFPDPVCFSKSHAECPSQYQIAIINQSISWSALVSPFLPLKALSDLHTSHLIIIGGALYAIRPFYPPNAGEKLIWEVKIKSYPPEW